jgi:hypothetical protein
VKKKGSVVQAMYPDLTTGPPMSDPQPCAFTFPPASPMNQIDNSWALSGLYEGRTGVPYTLPSTYSPPLAAPNPQTLTPTADGLVGQIEANGKKYGWSMGMQMYEGSHGLGLCAGAEALEYGLTEALTAKNPANSGAALHPNDAGQAEYATMLGAWGEKLAGVPVRRG